MTYRDRREARADRLREWADKRDVKAGAAQTAADLVAAAIPFGQPILIGHHSERGDRNRRDRMHNNMRRAHEDRTKAAEMRSKADNIDRAATNAIYSDDEDATERLTEKIDALQAARQRIKAYNASCRKGKPDFSLLTEKEAADLVREAKLTPYNMEKGGQFPKYHLTNLGGNINRLKKRLAALQAA